MTDRSTKSRLGAKRPRLPAPCTALIVAAMATLSVPGFAIAQSGAGQSAVVLNYQRFGETSYPTTSVGDSQFEAHVKLLSDSRYNVTGIGDIVSTLFAGERLPNRTIAITIDDAYRSAYDVAWPVLKAARLPFTVFVSTDPVDQRLPGYMSWRQIRELRDAGVTIGAHTASHPHMVELSPAENRADLERSLKRFEEELGQRPTLFSYPHGETSQAVREIVSEAGFDAAFGQHSGTVNASLDRYFLPRFSINAKYGAMAQFNMRLDTLGLPVHDLSPRDPYITEPGAPVVAFTLDESVVRGRKFACFYSQGGDPFVEAPVIELDGGRREIRFDEPFDKGAWRINCTMQTGGKRFRWFGMQFVTAG